MRREAGFSLLETVVMLVVVGLLVTGLAEGTRAGLATWSAERRWGGEAEVASTARVLRGLIEAMDPGDPSTPLAVAGTAHTLVFATDLPVVPPGQRTREAAVEIGLKGRTLQLRWTPRLPSPLRPPARHTDMLAPGISSLDLAYWRDGAWSSRWDGNGIPKLVRIRIAREPEAGPALPDIIAAPARAPP